MFSERLARQTGGRLLLRIEDIDTIRCRPIHAERMIEDLAWLGIAFDGPVMRQSEHVARHRQALAALEEQQLVYPCFCSRAEIAAAVTPVHRRDPEGAPLYPGTCRSLPAVRSGTTHSALNARSERFRCSGFSAPYSTSSSSSAALRSDTAR